MDKFSARSQQRAAVATKAGKFKAEIIPVPIKLGEKAAAKLEKAGKKVPSGDLLIDEGPRPQATFEKLQEMDSLHGDLGVVSAG